MANPNTAVFPGAVATDSDLFVANNVAVTALTSDMTSGDVTINVVSTSLFQVPCIITIDNEYIAVSSKTANTFTVATAGRGFNGSTAALHLSAAVVTNFVNSYYFNQLAAEVKAIETNLFKSLNPFGSVIMRRATVGSNIWTVLLPDGTLLNIAGSTTQGLQEAITYAWANGYPLLVMGGGVVKAGSVYTSQITCSTPLVFPTGWGNCYHFFGVGLVYTGTASNDFITFNSCDFTEVDFHDSQIIYPGTASAVRFNPVNDNGESFAGFTTSKFTFGTIVVVTTLLAPDPTRGIGLRISSPALGLGFTYGNGIFINNTIHINEINGGLIGLQVDNPGGSGSTFQNNKITAPSIHAQGNVGLLVGTSAITNLIFGNQWDVNIVSATGSIAASIWSGGTAAGGDIYKINSAGFTTGILLNSSAAGNIIISSYLGDATQVTNNATSQTNYIIDSRPIVAAAITVTASPFVYQNKDLRLETVAVNGGTVSLIEISIDNVNFAQVAGATNAAVTLKPGQYVRVTYSVAPTMGKYV